MSDLRADATQHGRTVCATDVSDLKSTQRALRHVADHDARTGLLNRLGHAAACLLATADDAMYAVKRSRAHH